MENYLLKLNPNHMKFLIAFFGSLLYNFLLFTRAKDNCDKEDKEFPYGKYCKMNWDNWVLATLFAPVLVWYLNDIVALINTWFGWSLPVYEVYYLGAGVLVELALFGISKLLGWKETWVAPVHKEESK
jgi:hypothetical protein